MRLLPILKGECPNCEKTKIFGSKGNLLLLQIPKIHERCNNCNFKFEREPGFFFGAMFVSYALTAAEFIAFSIVSYFLLGMSLTVTFIGVVILAILMSTLNFRMSRIIWIYIFANSGQNKIPVSRKI
ncbi:DUF983 domain-containing protein [Arenibacter sp. TNZ]|jgi:uncharacterized protein (DUF983 family)|uniref:DUF983 domain-containing protein n=1 Tax=Arenibacter TaxID=178469 RepID=UPI000CD42845|nr:MULTISPECIES: DUF983 domain-containing protein [Arenibacter]MCM4173737.1 DUF983 domain-containing protein [Arenibacter sp. TNZ]